MSDKKYQNYENCPTKLDFGVQKISVSCPAAEKRFCEDCECATQLHFHAYGKNSRFIHHHFKHVNHYEKQNPGHLHFTYCLKRYVLSPDDVS